MAKLIVPAGTQVAQGSEERIMAEVLVSEKIKVAPEHKEFLLYGIKAAEESNFVKFYNGEMVDENGKLVQGVRAWLTEQGVKKADVFTTKQGDLLLLVIALDTEGTDWRLIEHFDKFLKDGFFTVQARKEMTMP